MSRWWLAALVGALGFLALDGAMRLRALDALNTAIDVYATPPPPDQASPSGYAFGQHYHVFAGADSYHWILQTQQMRAQGTWRVRSTDSDNAPTGREVHWAAPMRWWLAGFAWCEAWIRGGDTALATERSALYGNAILFGLLIAAISSLVLREMGATAATVTALVLVTNRAINAEFAVGNFDHHGVLAICGLLVVLFIAFAGGGWVKVPSKARGGAPWLRDYNTARWWFIAAAGAGAVGMWVSAASLIPVLLALGCGGLWGMIATRGHSTVGAKLEARLWRWWGLAGGAASVVFYLIEYWPRHLGWRLEVNHPLYAVAWAGGGELMYQTGRFLAGERPMKLRDGFSVGIALVAVVAPFVTIFAVKQAFLLSDPAIWRLHTDYIDEFSSILPRLRTLAAADAIPFFLVSVHGALLLVLPVMALWSVRRAAPPARAVLLLVLAPLLGLTLLGFYQVRWLTMACGVGVAALATVARLIWASSENVTNRRTGHRLAAALLMGAICLPYPAVAAPAIWRTLQSKFDVSAEGVRKLLMRDFAYWLRRRVPSQNAIILSGPSATTELIYHGGFKGIGTMYWENVDGLHTTIGILGAANAERARQLVEAHGITHFVVFPWGSFATEAARLAQPRPWLASSSPPAAFGFDLVDPARTWPDWLRPVVYHAPFPPDKWALLLEVDLAQKPDAAAVARAAALVSLGRSTDAASLLERVLAADPRSLPALVRLAALRVATASADGAPLAAAAIARIREADTLPLAEQITMARVAIDAGELAGGRSLLAGIWQQCDERSLRQLARDELQTLMQAAQHLDDNPPTEKLALAARALRESR